VETLALTITSFASFASHLLAARQRSTGSTAATSLAQKMARDAEEIALHFTHPGRARDDAVALFWQVAPLAFADPEHMQGALDPDRVTDRMVAAIRASSLAHDFTGTVLAEPLFRQVAHRCLTLMRADEAGV
jgi:hypothetical protein